MFKLVFAGGEGTGSPWSPTGRNDGTAGAGARLDGGANTISHANPGEDAMRPFRDGAKLLIVEDEFLIGEDLAYGPRREGISILGPYGSIACATQALDAEEPIGAAILDLNIRGCVAFDLAEKLDKRNIPFIFYTGYDSVIVPEKFRTVGRVRKPADWREIKHALFADSASRLTGSRRVKEFSENTRGLATMLPVLRRRAGEITADTATAERLVERTLERAITEIAACPAGTSMEHWLVGLLESTGIGSSKHLN